MSFRRYLIPLVILTLLWLILTRADRESLVLGIPFIALATWSWSRLSLRKAATLHVPVLLRFVPWFLWNSLRGGVDVAWRALSPKMSLKPGFVRYPLAIPPGSARVFLINCISLLPGTLSTEVEGDELILHALDTDLDIIEDTREVERHVLELFKLPSGPVNA